MTPTKLNVLLIITSIISTLGFISAQYRVNILIQENQSLKFSHVNTNVEALYKEIDTLNFKLQEYEYLMDYLDEYPDPCVDSVLSRYKY